MWLFLISAVLLDFRLKNVQQLAEALKMYDFAFTQELDDVVYVGVV